MDESGKLMSRVMIKGSIDDVWREITKTDEPQQAIFNSKMHHLGLAPGSPIRMRTPDNKYTGVVGEILEVDPPHRLSHTMKFTAYDDPWCRVTYELRETPDGVEFTLTSEDIPPGTKTAKDMARGGTFIVNTLKAIVENGRPSLGTRLLYGVFKALGPVMTPKKCLSENWPMEKAAETR
jgi:uncharacterized protein YndB with AHSA1/START domain